MSLQLELLFVAEGDIHTLVVACLQNKIVLHFPNERVKLTHSATTSIKPSSSKVTSTSIPK